MADQSTKVTPPALLQGASTAAMTAEKAAAPHPGVVPVASPGSPADGAAATIAAGMSARAAQLSTKLAGKGPQVQAKTQSGVAQLQGQDEANATQIQRVADGKPVRPPNGHGGIQATDFHTSRTTQYRHRRTTPRMCPIRSASPSAQLQPHNVVAGRGAHGVPAR